MAFQSAMRPLLPLSMILLIVPAFIGCSALTQNRAGTDPESPDPSLRTRSYTADYDGFIAQVLRVIEGLPRWAVVRHDIAEGKIFATRQTRLFRFVDDVEVHLTRKDAQTVMLDVFSASRVGKGDFGQNARNIRELLKALDAASP